MPSKQRGGTVGICTRKVQILFTHLFHTALLFSVVSVTSPRCCCYRQTRVSVSETPGSKKKEKRKRKSQFFTRAGHWGSSTGCFSLAVIKFVSELLDLSLIHRFLQPDGSRYWRVSSDLTGQRRRCGIGIALLHSTTEIWFATSRSTCWYDVLTDCREVYTTFAFFFFSFPERWPRSTPPAGVFALHYYCFYFILSVQAFGIFCPGK